MTKQEVIAETKRTVKLLNAHMDEIACMNANWLPGLVQAKIECLGFLLALDDGVETTLVEGAEKPEATES